jgi:hypothetical protein
MFFVLSEFIIIITLKIKPFQNVHIKSSLSLPARNIQITL